ncbi:FkbM family methyltransferase [Herbaspirillum huttiense]|uniref:FkbM family methyltransferase n=1 Tax=Herbaspirillum huttiense TaxID=863372 RepID=UPI0039AED9C2
MNYKEIATPDIEELVLKLRSELRRRRFQTKEASDKNPSERELLAIAEYERRVNAGELVEPLVEKVDLETLVGTEIYEKVFHIDESSYINVNTVRGIALKFYTPNLRALWQSFGQEYIEPELLNFIDGMTSESVFFDIGASTGVFSLYAAAKGIRTYCFEPEVSNFNILNTSAYLNHEKLKEFFNAFNIAVADKTATSTMFIRKFEAAAHEKILGAAITRDGSHRFQYEYQQKVLCMSLDEICEMEGVVPTDIKIDVDGAELSVIRGMSKVLDSPSLKRIFIEISENEESSVSALNMLLERGFNIASKKRVQNYFTEYNYTLTR